MLEDTGFLDDIQDEMTTGFLDDLEDDSESGTDKVSYRPEIHIGSSEDMSEVEDESVHLIVTSPPYNADWSYGSHDDDMDYAEEYFPMLARVFLECHRVLVPGGRMVVNTPSLVRDGRDGGFPIAAHIETMINDRTTPFQFAYEQNHDAIAELKINTDFATREWIVWNKGFNTDGLAPNGSYPKPWGILLNNMHEVAVVYQKEGSRDVSEIDDDVKESSEINKDSQDLCDDVWDISPESWDFDNEDESVPVFPEEFVKRCVKLWSYEGDTVLDPFGGRGTTAKVSKDMNRHSIIYEKREDIVDEIKEYVGYSQSGLEQW